jgi:hypothetical protein
MCPKRGDERVSLYGLAPEGALRALLAVRPDAADREEPEDDGSRQGAEKAGPDQGQ